jgi:hypothetical protein
MSGPDADRHAPDNAALLEQRQSAEVRVSARALCGARASAPIVRSAEFDGDRLGSFLCPTI